MELFKVPLDLRTVKEIVLPLIHRAQILNVPLDCGLLGLNELVLIIAFAHCLHLELSRLADVHHNIGHLRRFGQGVAASVRNPRGFSVYGYGRFRIA